MMGDGHEHWGWQRGGQNEREGFAPEDGDHSSPNDR
jgi:hypothetical protein